MVGLAREAVDSDRRWLWPARKARARCFAARIRACVSGDSVRIAVPTGVERYTVETPQSSSAIGWVGVIRCAAPPERSKEAPKLAARTCGFWLALRLRLRTMRRWYTGVKPCPVISPRADTERSSPSRAPGCSRAAVASRCRSPTMGD